MPKIADRVYLELRSGMQALWDEETKRAPEGRPFLSPIGGLCVEALLLTENNGLAGYLD